MEQEKTGTYDPLDQLIGLLKVSGPKFSSNRRRRHLVMVAVLLPLAFLISFLPFLGSWV